MPPIALSIALCFALAGWALTVHLFLKQLGEQTRVTSEERESHRTEIAQLHQARVEEVANLLQRIQAPDTAVAMHAAENAPQDPVYPDMEDDAQLLAHYEQKLAKLGLGAN